MRPSTGGWRNCPWSAPPRTTAIFHAVRGELTHGLDETSATRSDFVCRRRLSLVPGTVKLPTSIEDDRRISAFGVRPVWLHLVLQDRQGSSIGHTGRGDGAPVGIRGRPR